MKRLVFVLFVIIGFCSCVKKETPMERKSVKDSTQVKPSIPPSNPTPR